MPSLSGWLLHYPVVYLAYLDTAVVMAQLLSEAVLVLYDVQIAGPLVQVGVQCSWCKLSRFLSRQSSYAMLQVVHRSTVDTRPPNNSHYRHIVLAVVTQGRGCGQCFMAATRDCFVALSPSYSDQ